MSGADANGVTMTFSDGLYIDVFLNGIKLKAGEDYNTNTANTVAGISAMNSNDEVEVITYDAFTVTDTVSAADGGTFSGAVTMNGNNTVGGNLAVTGTTNLTGAATLGSTLTTSGLITASSGIKIANDGNSWSGNLYEGDTNLWINNDGKYLRLALSNNLEFLIDFLSQCTSDQCNTSF